MTPLFAPKMTSAQLTSLFDPLLLRLTTLGITYTFSVDMYPSFQTAFDSISSFVDLQVGTLIFGGRILPRSLFQAPVSFNKTIGVLRGIVDGGGLVYDIALKPTVDKAAPSNAVLPAWRDAERLLITLLCEYSKISPISD